MLASGDVASGCRVKRVANDGYSYFFAKKCTSKRGLAVFIQKLRRYYLVDVGQGVAPRNCNQQPRVVKKWNLILCIKAWVSLALTVTR